MDRYDIFTSGRRRLLATETRKYNLDPNYMGGCECSDCKYARKNVPANGDYRFELYVLGDDHIISAGCRLYTIAEYRRHAADEYRNQPNKYAATLAILRSFEKALKAHKLKLKAKKSPAKKAAPKKRAKAKAKK